MTGASVEKGPLLLAIDPGTRCGWAVHDGCQVIASGVWDLKPPRGASPGTRYLYLRARLNEVSDAFPSQLRMIVVEQAHHRGGAATEYAMGVLTHVQSWCAEQGIEHATIHGARVKSLATGKGNASKEQMLGAAARRWPDHRFEDDNEADARWIAEAAAKEWGGARRGAA